MAANRITAHPILRPHPQTAISISWNGQPVEAFEGEPISSALTASGIRILGHHPKDGAPQGLFCASGRCAQCLVVVGGRPVKACVTPVHAGMRVQSLQGLPELAPAAGVPSMHDIEQLAVDALIVGGGPSGLAAAIELGKLGVDTLLIDDRPRLGGKLVLQTHRFFGSASAVYAGTRGVDIAAKLEREVRSYPSVRVLCSTAALAVFEDQKVGILRGAEDGIEHHARYAFVRPRVLLVMTGARERFLLFRGNTLPGVLGAGAFQTLVNRDLVRPAERVFIVGGGNVGLIVGYHAIQAGIQVVGLVEALPQCPGYRVHEEKLRRQSVPIHTSHTILSANGQEQVESVTVARVDEAFHAVPGTERSFACDAVLVAVGLDPENDLYLKARELGMTAFVAGDAQEIAEASSALLCGKIRGLEAARALGREVPEIPAEWHRSVEILKSRPGKIVERPETDESGIHPVFHCVQEIPCDPCSTVCDRQAIYVDPQDIRKLPVFIAGQIGKECTGCEKCVTICPGQAIALVDSRMDPEHPFVTIPHELETESLHPGSVVTALDVSGGILGNVEVVAVHAGKVHDRTAAVKVKAPRELARKIAGIRTSREVPAGPMAHWVERLDDDAIVCRCERVTAETLRSLIRQGYRDVNELKAMTRAGMGACGAKTCGGLVDRLFREEGIPAAEVHVPLRRPLLLEVPLSVLGGGGADDG